MNLVEYAQNDTTNTHKEINFGTVPNFLAQSIKGKTNVDVKGATKKLNANGVRHAFSSHGDDSKEKPRGQVGIKDSDFEFLPQILNDPDDVIKGNNSRKGQDAVMFVKKINHHTYHVVMSVVYSNNQDELVFNTMYIKK